MALTPGSQAPDFELRSHRGGTVRLSELRGLRNVVLAFHPFAYTPVCAAQMMSYEGDFAKFDAAGATVFGISTDQQPSKTAWARELGIESFELLSDSHPYGEVARKYGVFRDDAGFAERAVFVIDKNGIVRWSRVYDIPEHPDNREIFEALRTFEAS